MRKIIFTLIIALCLMSTQSFALDTADQFSTVYDSGSGAMAVTVQSPSPPSAMRLIGIRVKVSTAATTAEDLTVTIDSHRAASYEPVVLTKAMATVTSYEYRWDPSLPIPSGDKILISWTNTDARTWYIEVFYK